MGLSFLLTQIFSLAIEKKTQKMKLFISYSRRNKTQATAIVGALEKQGFDVKFDTRDLPFGEKWRAEIESFIREADTVVWLVSPYSVESQWCEWELGEVGRFKKRLIPVMIDEVPHEKLPGSIGEIQVLPASGSFDIDKTEHLTALVDTLEADRSWLKEHTRLSDRAGIWERANRHPDWLLRGAELAAAETWREAQPDNAPEPTALVLDLLHASRVAENQMPRRELSSRR
jgi:hypothetical protein